MDGTVPDPSSQLDGMESWLFEGIPSGQRALEHLFNTQALSPGDSGMPPLPGPDAAIMNELFVERVVPKFSSVLVVEHDGSTILDRYSGLSLDHAMDAQPEIPAEVPQPVASTQPLDEDRIVRAVIAKHRAPFAQILSNAGLTNWTLLGDVMLAKFFSDAGTQTSRPFFGWREEMYGEFITNMYDSLLRRGVTQFEYRELEISIQVKGKTAAVQLVKAHSTLTDSHFMGALQRMLSEEFPRSLTARWGSAAAAMMQLVLPPSTPDRIGTALGWMRRTVIDGIYTYPFLHASDTLNPTHAISHYSKLNTFMAISSSDISADGVVTFSLLRHCNAHTFSVVASLVLTVLELIAQKKGGSLDISWTPGDTKEKKFRDVQKAVSEEVRAALSCNCDTAVVSQEKQEARRNKLLHAFSVDN